MSMQAPSAAKYSIGELAGLAKVSVRTVRFYVQRQLLPPPLGLGRGQHYTDEHLTRLRQIRELQEQGRSLEAIARRLQGPATEGPLPVPPLFDPADAPRLRLAVPIMKGVEVHLDSENHHVTIGQIVQLRQAIRAILGEPGVSLECDTDPEQEEEV
jgi:DNA-binding transcriptional MerR regulator